MSNRYTRAAIFVDANAIRTISQDQPLVAQELAYACGIRPAAGLVFWQRRSAKRPGGSPPGA